MLLLARSCWNRKTAFFVFCNSLPFSRSSRRGSDSFVRIRKSPSFFSAASATRISVSRSAPTKTSGPGHRRHSTRPRLLHPKIFFLKNQKNDPKNNWISNTISRHNDKAHLKIRETSTTKKIFKWMIQVFTMIEDCQDDWRIWFQRRIDWWWFEDWWWPRRWQNM